MSTLPRKLGDRHVVDARRAALERVPVLAVMRPTRHALPLGRPYREAESLFADAEADSIVVTSSLGWPLGYLDPPSVDREPSAERAPDSATWSLGRVARPLAKTTLTTDASAADALAVLTREGSQRAVVVEDGAAVGLVDAHDLLRLGYPGLGR